MKQHRADDDGPRRTTKRGKSTGSVGRRRGKDDVNDDEEEGGEGVAAVADEGAIRRAWEHYLNFVNSNDDDGDGSENGEDGDEDGGDVDELLELIGILDPSSLPPPPSSSSTLTSTTIPPPPSRAAYDDRNFHLGDDGASATKNYLVPVLLSMSHIHLASRAVSEAIIATVGGDADASSSSSSSSSSSPEFHFAWSLHHWPTNPVAHSLLANYRRMDHALSLECVCDAYGRAALCAHRWRRSALDFLGRRPSSTEEEEEEEEGGGIDANEWVELLILNGALDVEYFGEDDDDGDGGDEGEEEENDDDEGVGGAYSFSEVEATASFMSAFLLSTLSRHDEALDHLRKFRLTHRVHPNVWRVASAGARPKPLSMSLDRRTRIPHSLSSSSPPPSSADFSPRIYCGWGSGDDNRLGDRGGMLPPELYRRMCDLFAPGAAYWKESDYDNRGYYSYYLPLNDRVCKDPTNVVEDVIVRHLLPIVERSYREKEVGSSKTSSSSSSSRPQIVGAEWWVHTRPLGANLGHQLHFDTDECLLNREGRVTHPSISSVMYLTGAGWDRRDAGDPSTAAAAGATVVFDQTPESKEVAPGAWVSHPRDNAFMIFPGNLLHGVLPCIGGGGDDGDDDSGNDGEEGIHRLTLMVGFWMRDVTEGMGERDLYTTCGPMPPATSEHSWVVQARRGYGEDKSKLKNKDHQSSMRADRRGESLTYDVLPSTSPAWDEFSNDGTSNLTIPKGLDHRFFVLNAPRCFSESLYEKGGTL